MCLIMLIKWQNFGGEIRFNPSLTKSNTNYYRTTKQICYRPSKRSRQDKILQNVPYYADLNSILGGGGVTGVKACFNICKCDTDIFKADLRTISSRVCSSQNSYFTAKYNLFLTLNVGLMRREVEILVMKSSSF